MAPIGDEFDATIKERRRVGGKDALVYSPKSKKVVFLNRSYNSLDKHQPGARVHVAVTRVGRSGKVEFSDEGHYNLIEEGKTAPDDGISHERVADDVRSLEESMQAHKRVLAFEDPTSLYCQRGMRLHLADGFKTDYFESLAEFEEKCDIRKHGVVVLPSLAVPLGEGIDQRDVGSGVRRMLELYGADIDTFSGGVDIAERCKYEYIIPLLLIPKSGEQEGRAREAAKGFGAIEMVGSLEEQVQKIIRTLQDQGR